LAEIITLLFSRINSARLQTGYNLQGATGGIF